MLDMAYGLVSGTNRKGAWDQPGARRLGLRDLHRINRYGCSFRAPQVKPLHIDIDYRLHDLEKLRWYTSHPFTSGLCVLKGNEILYEHYAPDFGNTDIHSIQSISKTLVFLLAGRLVEQGQLQMERKVSDYIENIGSGYADSTLQSLFDMAVVNDYSEDYYDSASRLAELEDVHGWQILQGFEHTDLRTFLTGIGAEKQSPDHRGEHYYKTPNTDIAAWICEKVSGHSLRSLTLEIIEAAGTENPVFVTTDREGVPFLGGGLHMTLRDLARFGLLLCAGGRGVGERAVGSARFLESTIDSCREGTISPVGYYRNFLFSDGSWVGHLGYGGQWLMAYPRSGIVIACLSAIEDRGGLDLEFTRRLVDMGSDISRAIEDSRGCQ